MGAGIPARIPVVLDHLANHEPAGDPLHVVGAQDGELNATGWISISSANRSPILVCAERGLVMSGDALTGVEVFLPLGGGTYSAEDVIAKLMHGRPPVKRKPANGG